MIESPTEQPKLSQPQIVVEKNVSPNLTIDPRIVAQTMRELGVTEQGIAQTTVVLSDKPRQGIRGSQTPKVLDRLLHGTKDHNEGSGSLVRLTTVYRGQQRAPEEINHTLVHELEHAAQTERHDPRLLVGWANIIGGLALGGLIGNEVSKRSGNPLVRTGATVAGAMLGRAIGYKYGSPHEHQARMRAEQISTTAVSKK